MTNDRPYHPARTIEKALAEIDRCSGSLFDREVVSAFQDQCQHLVTHPPPSVRRPDRTLQTQLITDPG